MTASSLGASHGYLTLYGIDLNIRIWPMRRRCQSWLICISSCRDGSAQRVLESWEQAVTYSRGRWMYVTVYNVCYTHALLNQGQITSYQLSFSVSLQLHSFHHSSHMVLRKRLAAGGDWQRMFPGTYRSSVCAVARYSNWSTCR